jgi:transcriptional regulator of heat shock response
LAEERAFLKDYTVPFVQLDPMKVILVFSHEHNTFDKRKLLVNANPDVVRDSPKKVMDFIKDPNLRKFYLSDLEKLLEDYAPGRPDMKPDVIAQTLQLEKDRAKMAADAAAANGGGNIVLQQPGQQPISLNNQQVVQILQNLQSEVETQKTEIDRLTYENSELARKYEILQKELATAAPAPAPAAPDKTLPETIYV